MKISRHNYEEFFLLYVDDELNTTQKQEVELFVQQNGDLARELEMLLQTKLLPENNIVFGDKNSLLKTADAEININNYEEYFLLLIDNELNEKEKAAVEKFVLQHPQLQEELSLLQQTVLQPEKIEFTNKQILYKTEKEERRVVPFGWLRIAVAAAFIGLVGLIWWMVPAEKQNQPAIVKPNASVISRKTDSNLNVAAQPVIIKNKNENIKNTVAETASSEIKKDALKNKKLKMKSENEANSIQHAISGNQPVIVQADDYSAETEKQNIAVNNANNLPQRIQPDVSSLLLSDKTPAKEIKNDKDVYAANENNNLVKPAVYKELNTSDDNSSTLYLGSMEINKNKLRGIFKKASHFFGGKAREASNDDGKLQVANLQIDTQKL